MVKRMLTLAVVLAMTMTVGCSYKGGLSTTGKWMAGGAVVGGVVGGVTGYYADGHEVGEGVLIGVLGGAAAGGLIGNIIEEQQTKEEIDALNKRIADLESENANLKADLDAANKKIKDLEDQIKKLQEELKRARVREVEISLGADVLFAPGSAKLTDAGKKALDSTAATLKSKYAGKFIMVEGHTDSDPIKHSGWTTNWELGAARALTVLHYLDSKGVDVAKMSAATFSKYQPVADNGSKDGKAKNRRAVLVVYKNWNAPSTK